MRQASKSSSSSERWAWVDTSTGVSPSLPPWDDEPCEAEAEEAEAETEDPLLSVLSGLPSIDNANDNAFLLDNLFGSDEDAIRKQKDFKDNFIGAHDGSGIDTRAAAMFGAGEDESDGDEDLLALMDMAADM